MKIKNFLSATGAFLVDISIVIATTIVIDKVLSHWIFISSGIIFLIVLFFYYLLMHVFCKRSTGKHFFGISLQSKKGEEPAFKKILLREVYKTVIGIGIPILIVYLYHHFTGNFYVIFPLMAGIWLIINLVYFIIKKESWWDTLTGTKKVKLSVLKQTRLKTYLLLLLIWGGSYLFLMLHNNYNNPSDRKYMGFKFPFKLTEYPDNRQIKPYKEFLDKSLQNPKDYILDLFQHYDIVILHEHSHQENSEWDLIYDVVRDPYFIQNVGNIFTENGAIWDQPKVDTFLSTSYPDDIS